MFAVAQLNDDCEMRKEMKEVKMANWHDIGRRWPAMVL